LRALAVRVGARLALLASLLIVWLNFAFTARWAEIPGSIHGGKRPWFFVTLAACTVLAARLSRDGGALRSPALARWAVALGALLLAAAFFCWFPPSAWTLVPFADNWPPRFQSTADGVARLRQGVVAGWEWSYLGGYHTSSDITQSLTALASVPMLILGDRIGFHVLHALLFAAIPLLVFLDVRESDGRDAARLSAAFACVLAANYSYFLVRSGDTNSLAGVVCSLAAIWASHAARRGRRWGGPALALALTLTSYSHVGFVAYVMAYLLLESVFYRDVRSAVRAAGAFACATVAALPLTWELWRYPAYFSFNNLYYRPPETFDWPGLLLKVYYNTEILLRPGRWFNDYGGLSNALLPLMVYIAFAARARAGFHAWAWLLTMVILRLNVPQFGYVFLRPIHMLPIFMAPALAWFVLERAERRSLAVAFTVLVALYIQISFQRVPHLNSVADFDPALVERVAALDGALVLVENNPHRNMNAAPGEATERAAFGVHYEALLAEATGRRLYAGFWDGWQWNPWRGQTLAGGTFDGRAIADVPPARFEAEMRRWGVRHLLVWSGASRDYLSSLPVFAARERWGPWTRFEYLDADDREVVVPDGSGRIASRDTLGAIVEVEGARRGDPIVVRANFHPVWTAHVHGLAVPLFEESGQLAFRAPADGAFRVALVYPRRYGLTAFALAALLTGMLGLWWMDRQRADAAPR
jgi:hypothetical protein